MIPSKIWDRVLEFLNSSCDQCETCCSGSQTNQSCSVDSGSYSYPNGSAVTKAFHFSIKSPKIEYTLILYILVPLEGSIIPYSPISDTF